MLTSWLSRTARERSRQAPAVGMAAVAATVLATALTAPAVAAITRTAAGQVHGRPAGTVAGAVPAPAALTGLACRTLTHCVAVGVNTPTMATQLTGEWWGGAGWHRLAFPKPSGAGDVATGGVTCPASHECVAVGHAYPAKGQGYYAIAGYWNGSRWRAGRAAAPGSSSELTAVSCVSATDCYAVGDYTPKGSYAFTALIEHWNGRTWRQQTAPVPHGTSYGMLTDVSCASGRFCVAAGTDGAGELLERWNGHHWSASTPKSPSSAMLYGVSCPSARFCAAVGTAGTPAGGSLVERWNGKAWSGSATPTPPGSSYPGLTSVSCVSAARCLAVGNDLNPGVYAVAWNGHTWHMVSMAASGGKIGMFIQVRCLAAASCAALAATTQIAATQRSDVAFWNGTTWRVTLTR